MEEILLDPIERKEFFLAKLGGQEVTPPDAVTRIEHYLKDIIDGNASTIPPITRMEYYLAKISGADVDVPDPVTRTEYYLAKIAGMDVDVPDPVTREEWLLAEWAGSEEHTYGPAALVSFETSRAKIVKSLLIAPHPTQAGSGNPSPDNVRPITGWTGANIYRTGKNLCYQPFPEYVDYNGTTWKNNEDGSVSVTGTPTAAAYCLVELNLPAGTYKVSGAPYDSAQGYNDILVQYPALTTIARDYNGAEESVRTFTLSSNLDGVRVILRAAAGHATDVTFYPMVTLASETSTAYEPYAGNTYSVDWTSAAGTVYGGTLDVVSGVLTVNMAHKNARDLTWGWAGSTYLYATVAAAQISDAKRPSSNTEAANVLCSVAVKNSIINMAGAEHQPGIGISATSGNMAVKLSQIESLEDWNDFIENTDVDIVYELATPLTYQLTPQEVNTLVGQNYVWSDIGDVTVKVRR